MTYATDANAKSEKNLDKRKENTTLNNLISPFSGRYDETILADRYNLGCNLGHRWYAPIDPSYWVGHKCTHPTERGGCPFPLHLLDEKGDLI